MNNRIISFDENNVVDVDKINSYVRSNVIVQKMYDKPIEVNGYNVMQYHVLETLNEYGKTVVRKNTICTTSNLFKINDDLVINRLLDGERLNEKKYGR